MCFSVKKVLYLKEQNKVTQSVQYLADAKVSISYDVGRLALKYYRLSPGGDAVEE
jgi:hypothetical protein